MCRRLIAVILVLLLVLAACARPGDVGIPGHENPPMDNPTDPEQPDEPAEPGTSDVTLRFPADDSGLPVDAEGNSVVERLVIHYWPVTVAASAEIAALDVPDAAEEVEVTRGESLVVRLSDGDYVFETAGYSRNSETVLVYGRLTVTVGPGSESPDLALRAVLSNAELATNDVLSGVKPGDLITFELLMQGAVEGTLVPAGFLDVVYDIDTASGSLMRAGADGLIIQVANNAPDFGISAVIRGPGFEDGELVPEVLFVAERQVTVQNTEPDLTDWQPPELRFDPIVESTGELTGFVDDDRGVSVIRIFRGQQQIGSSALNEQAGAVAAVSVAGNGDWSMPWTAPAGTSHLRALATDMNGNSTTAYRSTNVIPPSNPDNLSSYTTLSAAAGEDTGPDDFESVAGFCPANEFRTPGQGLQAVGAGLQAVGAGLQAVGAVGGVFLAPVVAFGDTVIHAHDAIDDLHEITRRIDQAPVEQVVLLVVDDYGPPGNVHYRWPTLHATPESLHDVTENGLLTHGTMVAQHSVEMFLALGYSREWALHGNSGLDPYEILHRPGVQGATNREKGDIVLQYVNIFGMDTTEMAGAIRDNIDRHRDGSGSQTPITRFVVNMSFVILPCAVTEDLAASGINSFEDYVAAVAAVNGVDASSAGNAVTDVSAEDELAAYLACPYPAGESCAGDSDSLEALVHVASSGNFGVDFPLYPAAYENVISVGSLDVMGTGPRIYSQSRSAFSNQANVLAPGSMFRLTTSESPDHMITYAGTSFAAPIVSVFMTHDMGQADECNAVSRGVPGDGLMPPLLAFASESPLYEYQDNDSAPAILLCHADPAPGSQSANGP